MNYNELYNYKNKIDSICMNIISNDKYSQIYKLSPFDHEIDILLELKFYIDSKLNLNNDIFIYLLWFNCMFNRKCYDINKISNLEDEILIDKLNYLNNYFNKLTLDGYKSNIINKNWIMVNIHNYWTHPLFIIPEYLTPTNKRLRNSLFIRKKINKFNIISNQKLNDKVVKKIKTDYKKGNYNFYQNKSNNFKKYLLFSILTSMMSILLFSTTVISFLYLEFNFYNIALIIFNLLLFFCSSYYSLFTVLKLKSPNNRIYITTNLSFKMIFPIVRSKIHENFYSPIKLIILYIPMGFIIIFLLASNYEHVLLYYLLISFYLISLILLTVIIIYLNLHPITECFINYKLINELYVKYYEQLYREQVS